MNILEQSKKTKVENEELPVLYRRDGLRWMMILYDSVFYLACWFFSFVLYPLNGELFSKATIYLYLFAGYLFFFGCRLFLECYRCILRYGKMHAFSRELLADTLGSLFLVLFDVFVGKVFKTAEIPLVSLVLFAGVYTVVSMFIRFVYCYLYRFATMDTVFSSVLKKLLSVFALVDFSSETPGATVHPGISGTKTFNDPINELQQIAEQFEIHGDITEIKQINKGYINRTYKVLTLSEAGHIHKYLLQRINTNVFPDVEALMSNFEITTSHLHKNLKLPGVHKRGTVQTVRPLKDGALFLKEASGCWRMLTYFDHVISMDIPDSPDTFYYAGVAFGSFIKEMSDVDVDLIKEVVPNFHNTVSRYQDLERAIENDRKGRVKNVLPEIEFLRARSEHFGIISTALAEGKIPTRICHNDCNLNNLLFAKDTHLPVAIIDLDTVMPSSPLYDFGDSMRIGTNTAKDDEKDLSKVSCDLNLYEKYAHGFLEACGDILIKEELELLPYASLIITAEDGIRFLMDHINGDIYYNIYYPGQNLDRARTQLKLLEDMEKKLPEIKRILLKIYAKQGLEAKITL